MAACGRAVAGGARVVSRLFTDRSARGRGTGTALLADAVRRAARLLRVAVLLVDPDSPARDCYLRRGWQPVGTAAQQWGHRTVEAMLLVQPDVRVNHEARRRTTRRTSQARAARSVAPRRAERSPCR